jgi:uncharacterized protein (TIGR02757 family)
MSAAPRPDLHRHLERLYETFDVRWLSPDPLEFVRRYTDPADQEIAGFFAAGLAYGRVGQILASLERIGVLFGDSPADFVRRFRPATDAARFRGLRHRFHGPRDFTLLSVLLGRALDRWGSLEALFLAGDDPASPDIGPGLAAFCRTLLDTPDLPPGPGVHRGRLAPAAPVRFFFSSPEDGSACKRLNLWLRWMVRGGDGLDLGAWTGVSPARLVVPLDTHVARIGRYIGLSSRKSADWKMAREVTEALRRLDAVDPVKYDFALCRLGILDRCPRRRDESRCAECLLLPVCTL